MRSKSEVLLAVKQFAKEIGAPDAIISDAAREQKSLELRKFCREIGTSLRVLEEGTPWANKAELYVGIIKEATRKDMKASGSPVAFWDYCVERRVRINNLTAKESFALRGSNAHSSVHGEEGDISNLCQFHWYEWCYFREKTAKYPFNQEVLGRVLGPATGEGNEMAQWILKANGSVVPRRSQRPLKVDEIHSPIEQEKRDLFDALIAKRYGQAAIKSPTNSEEESPAEWVEYSDDTEPARKIPEMEDVVDSTGKLLNQLPAYDKLLNAEVALQQDDKVLRGTVKQRSLGPDGVVAGKYDDNPMLNSIIFDVEFSDGTVKEYAANLIAENILTQVDSEGYSMTMMDGIVDHRVDPSQAVPKEEKYVQTKRGQKRLCVTTSGWTLLVRWKDGTETWILLKDMKESHPVEVAEYARASRIDDEAAFAWWVPFTLRKRDLVVSAVQKRIRKLNRKFGIEVPSTVEEAFELDRKRGNTMWRDALNKEMTNIGIGFEVLPEGQSAPPGWRKTSGHLVWDVKMDFTRKARWVLDGYKSPDPVGSKYAGVVSRESVRIALTYAALNGLQVFSADIRNAYLQAPSSQKEYIICGPEFGLENVGKVALIRRALYGGKSAGRDFRNHLRQCMHFLNFKSCPADPDVWMRPALKDDGTEYWEYVLLYTDDILCISANPERTIRNDIGKYFELKEESIGPPDLYLGGRLREVL